MKKEIKTYSVVCDCCEKELHDNGIRKNNGEFSEPYVTQGDIDLCYMCSGKIFYRDIVKKIPEETLRGFITSLREESGFLDNSITMPDIALYHNEIVAKEQNNTLSTLEDLGKLNTNNLKDL